MRTSQGETGDEEQGLRAGGRSAGDGGPGQVKQGSWTGHSNEIRDGRLMNEPSYWANPLR